MLCESCGTACECEDLKKFPDAQALMAEQGLDLTSGESSPELTDAYVAEYCELNRLKV